MSIARRGIFVLIALTVTSIAYGAGNPAHGKIKAWTCMGCHGIPGYTRAYPNYRVPKLGGQNAQYIVNALQEYKSGARKFSTMQIQAGALSSQDMEDIADYMTQAPHIPDDLAPTRAAPGAKPPARVAVCGACHGTHGVARQPMFPNLAGQYDSYLKQALHAYRSGQRKNAIMNAQAANLSDKEIDKLAAWFSSQPPKVYTPGADQSFNPAPAKQNNSS